MVFEWKWWSIIPKEPFWGLAMGWQDYIHSKTHQEVTDLIVADCTHGFFIFPTYFGVERDKLKETLSRNFIESRQVINDFTVVWLRAKHGLLTDKLELSHKVCLYNEMNEENLDLIMDVEDLEDIFHTRKHRYWEGGWGLTWEMPTFTSFVSKLKHLEQKCKKEFGDQ